MYDDTGSAPLFYKVTFCCTQVVLKMVLHGQAQEKGKNESTGSVVCKKAKFVCKDIVKKKKNPQQRLERYFLVTKQVRKPKAETNFQGFPLSECIYEEEVDDYVFKPSDYPPKGSKKEHGFCHKCFLRPCIVRGKWDDIMGFCEDIMVFENNDSEGMYSKLMNHADSLMVEVFGAKYVASGRSPSCVYEMVGNYHSLKSGIETEEFDDDPDDALVASALDG